MIRLVPMTTEKYQVWLDHLVFSYGQENAQNGHWPAKDASRLAREQISGVLTAGLATKDNFIYTIVEKESGQDVGNLWFAIVERHGKCSAFIYDIEIAETFRRHGYAFQALQALEPIVSALGATTIALHVVGFNTGARALYEKLGFAITDIQMEKKLSTMGG